MTALLYKRFVTARGMSVEFVSQTSRFLRAVLRVVTRCPFCVLYMFSLYCVFLVFLCVYTYKKITKIVDTFIFHTHMRRHGVTDGVRSGIET